LKNTTNQENNENISKIVSHSLNPKQLEDPKKALATRPINKYSFELAIENALKDSQEEENLLNEIAIADKILGDFNVPNSLLTDLEEATSASTEKQQQQQNYTTPVKNKNSVNKVKAIHYDTQLTASSAMKNNTPNLNLSEKIHQSGAKSREGSARRRSITDVILSPTYKEDLSKRISARKTEEQTNETSGTCGTPQTESSTKPKPPTKQQAKPQLLDCFSGKSSTNKAKTRFNNRTEGRVGLDKLKSMYSDIFESKKLPKKSHHTKKPSQIPSFIAENKPVTAPKPVVNSHAKHQPTKSRSHLSSKSFSIATSNHENCATQNSLLDTSLELQLKSDEANSKKVQQSKKNTTGPQTKAKLNSIPKTNFNLVSAAHSRSSSIGFRSTYQTLSVLNEPTPTTTPVPIQENGPKRLSKRSKSNVSFNSLLNRRRSSENTSFCVNSLIKQDKNEKGNTKLLFEPIIEVDDEKNHRYDEAVAKINENTFAVLKGVLKQDGVVYLCCQAFFNLFSGVKDLSSVKDFNFEEIQGMMTSPFELFNLVASYKNMVKSGEVPKENVHKALFTLAKIPCCDDDLQGKEYYDLLKFLTIAVEFYKSHQEVMKANEQTILDMSRISQKSVVLKNPSKNITGKPQEKGWEDGSISSAMKYVQEDLYQGTEENYHKKTEIIEKLKALQNRRSKSIGNAASLLPVSMERFKQRSSIHNIVNNVKERIKNRERRKSEYNLKSHSLMYPEDAQVEALQEQIWRDKVTTRDFRGKTKRLLVDHDRFVRKVFWKIFCLKFF